MATSVDVINAALVKLGEKRITSGGFATPTNERERIANEHYDRLRDAELRKNRWNFAMTRVVLAPDAGTPAWWYSKQYALPADLLRLVEVYETKDYQVEEGFIRCDVADELSIRYVKRVTVVNSFDPLFYDALACRIAVEFCDRLTGKRAKRQEVIGEYTAFMAQAANVDAIENPAEAATEDEWITCRA